MPEHRFERDALVISLKSILGKCFGEIDDQGIFDKVRHHRLQKGIAGHVIERCVFGYAPDSKQEADLVICDGSSSESVELKTTGMVLKQKPQKHFEAKETMSITSVNIDRLPEQTFHTSHFWQKLERLLIVYYEYDRSKVQDRNKVTAYDYRHFVVKGYQFHRFPEEDVAILKADWQKVRDLAAEVMGRHTDRASPTWKEDVKQDYISVHGALRKLHYIDLAPRFPPRFRLRQPVVSMMIARHFGNRLEQLPESLADFEAIDSRCRQLAGTFAGKSVKELGRMFGIGNLDNKAAMERIAVAMFGGKARSISQIEDFAKFGLIGKTIALSSKGGRTEDMKLFRIDFDEMTRESVVEDGEERALTFEESALYSYFSDHSFLCIIFKETSDAKIDKADNLFVGFRRISFSNDFIDTVVRRLWEDTRARISKKLLVDKIVYKKDGSPKINSSGEMASVPNFLKSKENPVFIRGSGTKSTARYKTEVVNGIRMLPQYVWIQGRAVVDMLEKQDWKA